MTKKKRILYYRIVSTVVLGLVSVVSLFPFLYIITVSFVENMTPVFKNGMAFQFSTDLFGFANYQLIATNNNGIFFSWIKNSALITILFTIVSIALSSMVGYGVAMYQFKLKRFIVPIILSTLMIPIETLMIPLYNEVNSFKLLNTYAGVILPFAVSAFTIYFFLQYCQSLPKGFMDAARIDGCGEIKIFFRIMIPLMKPAFASMIILQATNTWNDFLWPLIVMSENTKFTLTVGLQTYLSPYGNNYNLLFAGAVLSVLPVMILFFSCQKMFMEGMIMGGIKG